MKLLRMWIVFGRESCGYCKTAIKHLLDNEEIFVYRDIETRTENRTQMLELSPDAKTVPQIFYLHIGDLNKPAFWRHVGGCDEMLRDYQELVNESSNLEEEKNGYQE